MYPLHQDSVIILLSTVHSRKYSTPLRRSMHNKIHSLFYSGLRDEIAEARYPRISMDIVLLFLSYFIQVYHLHHFFENLKYREYPQNSNGYPLHYQHLLHQLYCMMVLPQAYPDYSGHGYFVKTLHKK